MIVTRQNDS